VELWIIRNLKCRKEYRLILDCCFGLFFDDLLLTFFFVAEGGGNPFIVKEDNSVFVSQRFLVKMNFPIESDKCNAPSF